LSFSVFIFRRGDGEEDVEDGRREYNPWGVEDFKVDSVKDVRRFRASAVAPGRDSIELRNFHRKAVKQNSRGLSSSRL
jgi:hypothetical protein